jgi:hypothetical protein
MAERKFGTEVVSHLRDMTKIRLKRKLLEQGEKKKPVAV